MGKGNLMSKGIVCLIFALLLFSPQAYAIPVHYSLFGDATATSTSSTPLSDAISGTMTIESNPAFYTYDSQSGFGQLSWEVANITIRSNVFNFTGSGYFHLSGTDTGLYNINEPSITGHGVTPYGIGNMSVGPYPNQFFDANGVAYQDSFSAYSSGLPHLIAPNAGAWLFDFSNSGDRVVISGLYAVRASNSAPVPEPSTIFLLGSGLAVFAGWRKRKFAAQ